VSSQKTEGNEIDPPPTLPSDESKSDDTTSHDGQNRLDVPTEPQFPGRDQPPSADQTATPGEKSLSDFSLAVDHHKSVFVKFWKVIEQGFHYFFAGCIGVLGLAIALAIPILILGCTAVVLGIPGYVLYQLLGSKEHFLPYALVLTIFWSGYFFTHGWPRLRDCLQSVFGKMWPLLGWVRTMLSSLSEREKGNES
jgi:hypothetical protein